MTEKIRDIWDSRFVNRIIDSMADGVFTMDASGRISSWNPAMERISGYTAREALGQTCQLLQCSRCFGKQCPANIDKCKIIGKSRAMQQVFTAIRAAAASEATILIQGESGTGKELVAGAIHFNSDRRKGPLVAVNCSALSENLLESELFGHVKGAFTGANRDRMGRFEEASGGSIFLDEIGELSPLIQVKLLRVLQEREVERVGDSRKRRIDIRIITATHNDLYARVREGHFREDLYYRLKVFPIRLPPLQERREDIPILADHFIRGMNRQTGKTVTGLSPGAMRIFMDYPWPGNVRELENAIEHAFVLCSGGDIDVADLPIEIRHPDHTVYGTPQDGSAPVHKKRRRKLTKDELIDYAIRSGAPMEVIENLKEIEDEGEVYDSIEDIWPEYPTKEDFFFHEDEY